MKKALIFTADFLFPINTGPRLRAWNFIRGLSKDYELSLLFHGYHPDPMEGLPEAKKYFKNVWEVVKDWKYHVRNKPTFWKKIQDRINFVPLQIRSVYHPKVEYSLEKIFNEHQFDVAIARYIYQGQYLFKHAGKTKTRLFIDLDDIEPRRLSRQVSQDKHPHLLAEWRKRINVYTFEQYHKRNFGTVEKYFLCSQEDKKFVLKRGWPSNIEVVPNGIEINRYNLRAPDREEKTILFCGVLNYEPNVDGILWFVGKVLPLIQQVEPQIKLLIVGRMPTPAIKNIANNTTIFVHADVPDVTPFYEQSSLVIAPIFVAGGTRIKILEAAACLRPVVATTIGAEGLGMTNRRQCMIEDHPEKFADACMEIINNPALAKSLIDENYQFVKNNFDIQIIAEKIAKIAQ